MAQGFFCGNKEWKLILHCIAEIRTYWVEAKPSEIDSPRHHS